MVPLGEAGGETRRCSDTDDHFKYLVGPGNGSVQYPAADNHIDRHEDGQKEHAENAHKRYVSCEIDVLLMVIMGDLIGHGFAVVRE